MYLHIYYLYRLDGAGVKKILCWYYCLDNFCIENMFSTSSPCPPRGKLPALPMMNVTKQGEDQNCQRDLPVGAFPFPGHCAISWSHIVTQSRERTDRCSPQSAVSVGTEEARAECMPRIYAAYWLLLQWVCGARSCTALPAAEKRMLETCTITWQLAHKHSYIHPEFFLFILLFLQLFQDQIEFHRKYFQ